MLHGIVLQIIDVIESVRRRHNGRAAFGGAVAEEMRQRIDMRGRDIRIEREILPGIEVERKEPILDPADLVVVLGRAQA